VWQQLVRRLAQPRGVLLGGVGWLAVAFLATAGALAQVPPVGATAEVRDIAGRLVATAELREGQGEVLITLIFPTPPSLSGTHAFHIQEVGRCDAPDFLTAGADFNPTNKQHGRLNPDGPHVGDLPNINLTNGLTSYNTSAPGATLGAGSGSLLGPNRTALVIYSGEDDQMTDPDGKSGSRIACGVVTPAVAPAAVPKPVATATSSPIPVAAPVTSPVAVRPAATRPAPIQVVPTKPGSSPVPAPPAVSKPSTNPAPVVAAASPIAIVAAPTPLVPLAAPAARASGGSLGTGPALLIAVLGVALVGAGYLLRRRSQLG
jgi:Cu-Zn family superoxide dismutase